MRENVRRERLDPKLIKSRAEIEDPKVSCPYTEKVEPARMNARIDMLDPRWTQSKILIDEPNLDMP
jgi:hypothetical protein